MNKMKFTVTGVTETMKIGSYLKSRLGFTSALITKVKYGGVFLDGVPVHMRAQVSDGMTVEVVFPEESSEEIKPMDIPLEVLYEDDSLIAVNKPRGMPTHPSKGNHLPTLANAVMSRFGGNFVFRAINRLDRDTSGVVLIAKDPYSAAKMSECMRTSHMDKRYIAKVRGVPKEPHGIIDAPIERESPDSIKRIVRQDGKRAVTEYTVICEEGKTSVLEIVLYTGRTHQIRVHMAHIGHPLISDFLYDDARTDDKDYMLHCESITLTHPITDRKIIISAPCDFYKR